MTDTAELTTISEDEAVEKGKKARRKYDLSVMEAEQPQLVRLVAWLITIPGASWTAIAEQAGMAWETVAAISARNFDVTAWRSRAANMVALVLEAAGPGLLKRAVEGELNAFEFKQLVDAWTQLGAQATVRHEHTLNVHISHAESELMRIIDGKSRTVQTVTKTQVYEDEQILSMDAVPMGLTHENLKTILPPPAPDPGPSTIETEAKTGAETQV